MNSIFLLLITVVGFLLAYRFYGGFLQDKIIGIDRNLVTPAHKVNDGIDYVPTKKIVLFGHHFATIAGLGPILGPAIGVIWGWVPAFLWVFFGSIFMGAVHDFGILLISMKNKGVYIGELAEKIIGKRVKIIFQFLVFFMLSLAMGVFVLIIAILFTMYPEGVIPTAGLIFIAMLVGTLMRKGKIGIVWSAVIGVMLLIVAIIFGVKFPVTGVSVETWKYLLLLYAYIASILPVWLLLQPRDYLNAYLLFFGLASMFLGVLILRPEVVAPAINTNAENLPSLFPFLFITIACGAISGFHNLASSGTTVRQIDKPQDAKFIGYGGMLTEGLLAVLVILAVVAGVGSRTEWFEHYQSWSKAGALKPKIGAFITGASLFLSSIGIPREVGRVVLSIMIVSFALTTLDSATRLLRYNIEELSRSFNVKVFQNRFISTIVAVVAIGYFALMKLGNKPVGLILWKLFGSTNQLLAALGLMVITVYLVKRGKPFVYSFIPMLFLFAMTLWAIVAQIKTFWSSEERAYPLIILSVVIVMLSVWMITEAAISVRRKNLSEMRRKSH